MYCFAEAGWEIFSCSFTAQAISLSFSGPFFGQFWICAATRTSHTKKPLPFTNCLGKTFFIEKYSIWPNHLSEKVPKQFFHRYELYS